ncbi:MAG: hypothetical protein COU65_01830 [Candidatus Pacebacteria bacterium CG10_big_fil_rev_8_21_14_0_10_42_12]|nr:MAG: hypothetical protein COU65_01830 [Candidatus Pacebacteria bacterium CG10_big_fil_rev_8_21_14_0_10_42_12]
MSSKKFLSITFFTIIITRLVLYFSWSSAPMELFIYDSWHHMYTGVLLMIISILLPKKISKAIAAIGLGLFLDELIHLFHLMGLTTAHDYWSFVTISTTILGILTTAVTLHVLKRIQL